MLQRSFHFVTPGPMVDRELELVAPSAVLIDEVLRECQHPLTRQVDPKMAATTRESLEEFLRSVPGGRANGDPRRSIVPAYHFWMRWHDTERGETRMAGGVGLRIGRNAELEYYAGHIGYHVFPPARGRHFAERACRLILPILKYHRIRPIWITANPDNAASRRTCERLGARYVNTVPLPTTHPFYAKGERLKCRYRWDV